MYVIKYIIVNDCFVICVGSSLLSKTVDVTVAVSSDFAGIYRVGEKASHPFPMSTMHKGGSIVITEVWCK